MNERIRELLEQAGVKYVTMPKDTVYEKFAELIVRECMSVADLSKNPSGQWDHLKSSEVIAKHFGVEE
jgi:hypothetical protein